MTSPPTSVYQAGIFKNLPVISWPALADLTYGTAIGAAQLNAVADVPGRFS